MTNLDTQATNTKIQGIWRDIASNVLTSTPYLKATKEDQRETLSGHHSKIMVIAHDKNDHEELTCLYSANLQLDNNIADIHLTMLSTNSQFKRWISKEKIESMTIMGPKRHGLYTLVYVKDIYRVSGRPLPFQGKIKIHYIGQVDYNQRKHYN